jgi:hypothetical protein
MNETKEYLGDGVYAEFDGYQVVLTTENGVTVTSTIYLEPLVIIAFTKYLERLPSKIQSYESNT